MILPIFTLWHKVAAIAALAVLAGIFGAWGGHKITKAHYVAKEIARVEAEQKEYARLSKIATGLGQALAAETRKRQEPVSLIGLLVIVMVLALLAAVALLLSGQPLLALIPALLLIGAGIGSAHPQVMEALAMPMIERR